ncbi:response regulator [Lachnospiraceae bacterium ZAX-1]
MSEIRMRVMVVDDNITNLRIAKNALSNNYDVFTVSSASRMFEMFELLGRNLPSIILLDVDMPQMNGYEAIKILKSKPETKSIPIVFLTGRNDFDSEMKGLSLGAIDYISKPILPLLLCRRMETYLMVETQKQMLKKQAHTLKDQLEAQQLALQNFNKNLQKMVDEKMSEKLGIVLDLQRAILKTVGDLMEIHDHTIKGQVERTQQRLKILVSALQNVSPYQEQISEWDIDLLLQSAQLYDVGKIAISDNILLKPGKITLEEFNVIKNHTTLGVKIVDKIMMSTPESDFLKHAKIFAGTHQEKWDGTGYPRGLQGADIPLQGRLMAIADVYDALTSERAYKKAFTHEEATQIIIEGKGTHFDPILIDVFVQVADQFQCIQMPS